MPSPSTLAVFAVAALALLVVPGPSVLYIVTSSAAQGRRAGLVSVAGIHAGTLVHVAAAAIGLSALIVSSAVAFTAVKVAGAAYLVTLGVLRIVRRGESTARAVDGGALRRRSLRRIFWEGVLVNVLNPKTAVFFLAFLPQFVDVDRGGVVAQLLVLGATFVVLGVASDGTYAMVAGTLARRLRRSPRAARTTDAVSGAVYVALGVSAARAG